MKTTTVIDGVEYQVSLDVGAGSKIVADDVDDAVETAVRMMRDDASLELRSGSEIEIPREYVVRAKSALENQRRDERRLAKREKNIVNLASLGGIAVAALYLSFIFRGMC